MGRWGVCEIICMGAQRKIEIWRVGAAKKTKIWARGSTKFSIPLPPQDLKWNRPKSYLRHEYIMAKMKKKKQFHGNIRNELISSLGNTGLKLSEFIIISLPIFSFVSLTPTLFLRKKIDLLQSRIGGCSDAIICRGGWM